ncbi:hypothetical protein V1478_000238 [Vespula squamosa]|uniref:Uncharacterized protein n=1 Tax=Vespula squamosa TaxID=30214 RepID=A0ABD2C4X9_VESSQ
MQKSRRIMDFIFLYDVAFTRPMLKDKLSIDAPTDSTEPGCCLLSKPGGCIRSPLLWNAEYDYPSPGNLRDSTSHP